MVKLRSKKVKDGYSLYIEYYHKKVRSFQFLHLVVSSDYTSTKAQKRILPADKDKMALAHKIHLKAELDFIENGYKILQPKKSCIEFFEEKAEEKNHRTYKQAFRHLTDFLKGKAFDAKKETYDGFHEYLKALGLSGTSVYHYGNRISILANLAVKSHIISCNEHSSAKKINTTEKVQATLSVKEIASLCASAELDVNNYKTAFIFACYTGMRISEIQALKWTNIYLEKEIPYLSFVEKKTHNERTIQLHDYPLQLLKNLYKNRKDKELVFEIAPTYINVQIAAWTKELGIDKHVHFHTARHTFGTLLHEYGVDIYTIQKLINHSNIASTEKYTHINDKRLISAVNSLPSPFLNN